MKRTILGYTFVGLLLIIIGCATEDKTVNNDSTSTVENSFDFTMSSYPTQRTTASSSIKPASFTADQIMTGQLTALNTDTSASQTFDWSIYFDETTWEVQSNKTILLTPGNYQFSLLLIKGDYQYAGTAALEITDGTTDVPMTIRPIIGDTVSNVSVVAELADFKFQYDPDELSTAEFTAPQLGVTVDGGAENIFTLNPATGISDNYINLSEGTHQLQLKLYDGSFQKGKSLTAQETVVVSPGLDIVMDLVALHGETTFALSEAGGDALFQFTVPSEVIDEAGGVGSLETLFSLVGPNNALQENTLNLSLNGSGDYEGQVTLSGLQFDTVTLSLTFSDTSKSPKELLGSCNQNVILDTAQRTTTCGINLSIRAITSGSLLATLGINVFNEASEPVAGATVYNGETILGITGSGTFGTQGYLKVYLNAGNYLIRAEDATKYDEETVTLAPLGITNLDMILDTEIPVPVLPDTGQTASYTSTFGEDHDYLINPPSYTDNGNGTVTDNNTLLMWQQTDDNTYRNWDNAIIYCQDLTLGGFSDWRLPYVKELQTIVDYENLNHSINTAFFQDTLSTWYWSFSTWSRSSSMAWSVAFTNYYINARPKSESHPARCVRSGSHSDSWQPSFLITNNEIVTHQSTNLTWQREDDNTTKNWENAISYCEGLNLSGYSDWRLPNARELQSIVDYSEDDPAINNSLFPNTKGTAYWSSTTHIQYDTSNAIFVMFGSGYLDKAPKSSSYYVRCVRGGQ